MHHGWLVLGGFLLGTLGVKAVTSRPAKKAAVRATACGLHFKDYVNGVVDEAKAQCDDIMAEAIALKDEEDAESMQDVEIIEEVEIESVTDIDDESTPAKSSKTSTSKKTQSKTAKK